jgi:tetratricopeptide (TPR) repeat protein
MPPFANLFRQPRRALSITLCIFLLGITCWVAARHWRKPDPLLATPTLALESLQARTLYFNNAARPWLLAQRPDLLTEEDRDEGSDKARGLTQAVQNPKLFRQLDRQYRFDAVLLTGDPSQYKPLLDHLVETKDWKLAYVDHTSLVFRRENTKTWEVTNLASVSARLAKKSAQERATALAQTATKLLAAGQPDAGRQLLDEATQFAPHNPEVANGLAIYHLGRGEWREAAAHLERALSADSDFLPALATKTQLLYGTKRFSEAYDLSRQLIAKLPQDPGLLFYHAKIAHEAHAFKAEIEALEKLITWAEIEGRPIGGYQLYLGQAYAATGDAERSVDNFMLSLNDPDLPNDQRAFARENIARIKKRTGQ